MEQRQLPLLARIDAPSVAPHGYVTRCTSYRDAVRMCWSLRRRIHLMTQRQLSSEAGLRPQLVSDFLHSDDRPTRRDLPGQSIAAFERVAGNTCISQWVAAQSQLTVLEEMQAERVAA